MEFFCFSSPTLTTAPTTRATSPSMVFPGEGPGPAPTDYCSASFSKRRISVIEEVEETTPRPGTVVARTPTNRESMTPQEALRAASKTPSFYQSAQTGEVGYLNPMAGVPHAAPPAAHAARMECGWECSGRGGRPAMAILAQRPPSRGCTKKKINKKTNSLTGGG